MDRIELFEFGDISWVPQTFHIVETDFLEYYYNLFNLYGPIYDKIVHVLNVTDHKAIIDLCSGAGGPVVQLRKYLDQHNCASTTITLTDINPNLAAFDTLSKQFPHHVIGHTTPVDACNVPAELQGMRTFFTAFHHFPHANTAKKLLQDAVDNRMPIGIFEISERSVLSIGYALLSSLVLQILLLPQMRPFSWRKLFFIYVLPLIPLMMSWDYLISCLRTYSLDELSQIISQLDAPNYHWEMGKKAGWHGLYQITYLVGYQK